MTKTLLLLFCLIGALPSSAVGQEHFYENTVVVRLMQNSPEAQQWLKNGRSGSFQRFEKLLGNHRSEGYLLDATIKAVTKAELNNNNNVVEQNRDHHLAYIAIIRYDGAIDPVTASRKLSKYSEVVYAEPLAKQFIVGVPNDTYAKDQYHLYKTRATEAWDELPASPPIVVGIVDTGIDTTHEDLRESIWKNPGETGLDGNGSDKRFNGIDDDGNGFVDDWFGWDFVGPGGDLADNSPLPGHPHGTHVGGLVGAVINNEVGVAGTAPNVKIIPIKVGGDSPFARSVSRTADGILYAASVGAKIINCSFGSASPSMADEEVVNTATRLGSLVVCAAGNDALNRAFYPAAYPASLSVAATNNRDELAFFSNRHSTVDVSAPGDQILSTFPENGYDFLDGTSMSAPIVAAIAAMVAMTTPNASPEYIHAMLKANTDNIDDENTSFVGLIGTGRVNALKSVRKENSKFVEITSVVVSDTDGDNVATPGDELHISLSVINQLDALTNGRVEILPAPSNFMPIIDVGTADLGSMGSQTSGETSNDFVVRLPLNTPLNAVLSLSVVFYDGQEQVGTGLITRTVNPSYRTINENDVALSINSAGNIGYNDYPANIQGIGVRFRGGPSLLFEGAFLVGHSPKFLPNSARSADPSYRDGSFRLREIVSIHYDSVTSGIRAVSRYSDSADRDPLGVDIKETVYQPTADSLRTGYLVQYDITNPSDTVIKFVHAAMFMDWDMTDDGADDGCAWQRETGIGFVRNVRNLSVPIVGVSMISALPTNFFALDNAGLPGVPGIYDHFLRGEKWYMMSSGIERENTNITDVSMMIGGGPFDLAPGATAQIVFAVAFGANYEYIGNSIKAFRSMAMELGLNAVPFTPLPLNDSIFFIEGGPAITPGLHTVRFSLSGPSPVQIQVVNVTGEYVATVFNEFNVTSGEHTEVVDIPNVATGTYFLVMTSYGGTSALPIQIIP